jgi:hypothetical protein
MGNFSRDPDEMLANSLFKGYVRVHIEQGVPVLDRDLNLMQDLIWAAARSIVARYIGDGVVAGSQGFAILPISGQPRNFRILAGFALVNGIEVFNQKEITYTDQPGVPALTLPPNARTDTVYLDVSLADIDGTQDAGLLNSSDVGLQTSVRKRATWVVRVAEGASVMPAPASETHAHLLLAQITRRGGAFPSPPIFKDRRRQIVPLGEVMSKVGRPVFAASGNQFTPPDGGAGTEVTVRGRNLNLGELEVYFVTDSGTATIAEIISAPTDTEVVVKAPVVLNPDRDPLDGPGPATPFALRIKVETRFGTDLSDDTFKFLPVALA